MVLMSTETTRLIRDGEGGGMEGGDGGGGGERQIIYLSLNCHHKNDSCIKAGSDESHFNVWLVVRDKVTRRCPQTATFLNGKGEPKRYRTKVLLLTSLTPYRLAKPIHVVFFSNKLWASQNMGMGWGSKIETAVDCIGHLYKFNGFVFK